MSTTGKIIETLKASIDPMSAGQIADATGIERKEIDKGMKELKGAGKIISPKRCYWTVVK